MTKQVFPGKSHRMTKLQKRTTRTKHRRECNGIAQKLMIVIVLSELVKWNAVVNTTKNIDMLKF